MRKRVKRWTLGGLGLLLAGTVLAATPTRPPGRDPEATGTRPASSERHRQQGSKQG